MPCCHVGGIAGCWLLLEVLDPKIVNEYNLEAMGSIKMAKERTTGGLTQGLSMTATQKAMRLINLVEGPPRPRYRVFYPF